MIICKYVFDSNTYNDYLPVFNDGFTYTKTDIVEDNLVTRTIESDVLPNYIKFGGSTVTSREQSLLQVLACSTSNITNMQEMFANCTSLTSLDLSSFDTSKVTNMAYMFRDCYSLTSLDLSSFDTNKVTSMGWMFCNCIKLTSLDLSNFDTSKVNSMQHMFNNCRSLTSLDVSNWNIDLTVLTNYTNVLLANNALEVIDLSYASEDTITVFLSSVPSQAITVKTTPENVAYATDTAPSNVTVIDVIAIMNINTTKQQLIYNILYNIINGKIKPQTTEELLLYSIMMKGDR